MPGSRAPHPHAPASPCNHCPLPACPACSGRARSSAACLPDAPRTPIHAWPIHAWCVSHPCVVRVRPCPSRSLAGHTPFSLSTHHGHWVDQRHVPGGRTGAGCEGGWRCRAAGSWPARSGHATGSWRAHLRAASRTRLSSSPRRSSPSSASRSALAWSSCLTSRLQRTDVRVSPQRPALQGAQPAAPPVLTIEGEAEPGRASPRHMPPNATAASESRGRDSGEQPCSAVLGRAPRRHALVAIPVHRRPQPGARPHTWQWAERTQQAPGAAAAT